MDGEPETLSETATNYNNCVSETLSDNNQARLDSLEKKAVHIRLVLEKDFKAADLKWSLFVGAAFSYRYESCLRPFPPAFMNNGAKDMDELLSVITDVPALDLVLQQLDNTENLSEISDVVDLLFYVLVRLKEPNLKTIPIDMFDAILTKTQYLSVVNKPHYIFQVMSSSSKSAAEMKWKELAKHHSNFFAYHGNRLENFYSILNFGFQNLINKNMIANGGGGVYLSPDLSLCLPYSHGGYGWGASCIGGHLSCVALCEVIDAPEGINYQKPVTNEGDGAFPNDNNSAQKDDGDVLNSQLSHYIVANPDLVRVRYLLVYAKQPTSLRFPTPTANRNAGGIRSWFSNHKMFSILLGYGLMLATIGFANNHPVNFYYGMLLKKIDLALGSIKI